MATITHDGQSFMIDGRRLWLVSGLIDYFRTPPENWGSVIRTAAEGGLNTILVRCPWAVHEPRRGEWEFSGGADVRRFVEMIGEAGMSCILRPGPFVGTDLDFGGLPAWLLAEKGMAVRAGHAPFLEATSQYFSRLFRDLAPLSAERGGPIVLMQVEHEWYCGNAEAAEAYLWEIARFIREHEFGLPLVNTNSLWQRREETIDLWTGRERLLADLRQLRAIHPESPLMVGDFWTGETSSWGQTRQESPAPYVLLHRLAQVLASGAQFNLSPFAGGTNFAFMGARLTGFMDRFGTTSADHQAPVSEAGERTESFRLLRRICTFASQFGRVFAALAPTPAPAMIDPQPVEGAAGGGRGADESSRGPSIVHLAGTQGQVLFIFEDPKRIAEAAAAAADAAAARTAAEERVEEVPDPISAAVSGDDAESTVNGVATATALAAPSRAVKAAAAPAKSTRIAPREYSILLPDGTALPVTLGDQPVAWLVMDIYLGGRAKLDWTTLNVFASNGKDLLVLYGPAGRVGRLSINSSRIDAQVPTGPIPTVEVYEDITIVVCNEDAIDRTYLRQNVVHVGVDGFDEAGSPIGAAGWPHRYEIRPGGKRTRVSNSVAETIELEVKLGEWTAATIDEYLDGSAARYATIDGPGGQERCGAGWGYGLIRLTFPKGRARRAKLLAPGSGDRLHVYVKGQMQRLVGVGPGAEDGVFDLHVPAPKFPIVMLVDNLGRFGGGNDMNEVKGLVGHVHEVEPIRLGKPAFVDGPPLRPFQLRAYVEGMHGAASTSGRDLEWAFEHRRKSPIIVEVTGATEPALVVVNGVPLALYAGRTGRPSLRLVVEPEHLKQGKNLVRLAPFVAAEDSGLAHSLKIYESTTVLTKDAVWAFAKWERPRDSAFRAVNRGALKAIEGRAAWFRTTFTCKSAGGLPIWFEPAGLSKGQIFLNGRNLGRYFAATHEGKTVPPQKRYLLPRAWVSTEAPNDLVIFDEHGMDPTKSRIVPAISAF